MTRIGIIGARESRRPCEPGHSYSFGGSRRLEAMVAAVGWLQRLLWPGGCYGLAARGRGVGRALIEAVYERARVAGVKRVYWHTHETNLIAMCLYDQVAKKLGAVMYRREL